MVNYVHLIKLLVHLCVVFVIFYQLYDEGSICEREKFGILLEIGVRFSGNWKWSSWETSRIAWFAISNCTEHIRTQLTIFSTLFFQTSSPSALYCFAAVEEDIVRLCGEVLRSYLRAVHPATLDFLSERFDTPSGACKTWKQHNDTVLEPFRVFWSNKEMWNEWIEQKSSRGILILNSMSFRCP